jgi:hypothetical protein
LIHAWLSYSNAGLATALQSCILGHLEAEGGLEIWFIFERLHYLTWESNDFVRCFMDTNIRTQEQAVVSGLLLLSWDEDCQTTFFTYENMNYVNYGI